ncbi:cytochrome P450 2C15-like [Amphibalanus amphitrite]|uniref:cytochrome P450 2C15-like n=1 Tax=Amphibalanus amphitrite TaxID=1232801 RepID=UPI001C9218E7|nr:cytochrome P450 2C15-like [Amphibalanus amphitrite]XP_043235059.1 cytochrome P450 2C15-like [Amphibalanus amphitrite]
MWVVAVTVLVVLVALVWHRKTTNKNLPPGPGGLPVIGQLTKAVDPRKELHFLAWKKQYGPIFHITSMSEHLIVLSEPDLIREAFSKAEAADRISNVIMALFYADKGLIFSSGELWKQSRRFSLHHLRNFGMGGAKLESVIQDHVQDLLDKVVAPSEGKPLNIDRSLRIAISNVIWGMVSSQKFAVTDTRALDVLRPFDEISGFVGRFVVLAMFPILLRLPHWLNGLSKVYKIFNGPIDTLLQPALDEHERTVDLNGEPRDYIDCMLQERSRNPQLFTNRHMIRSILDLFLAGHDTTAVTIEWAFIYLCQHPEVQRKVREEITNVVGKERPPALSDRTRMPYTEAFIMETQRVANTVPTGVEHVTREEIQLGGYTIPRGAQVISLLMAVHMDEKHFPEPEVFRPERFLDDQGRVKPNRALMPFSVGKRSCLGEALARAELFLFVTALLQRYSLRFPDGFDHDLSCNQKKMLVREPSPYELVLERV